MSFAFPQLETTEVRRLEGVDPIEIANAIAAGEPFVVAIERLSGGALRDWTVDRLISRYGDLRVPVKVSPEPQHFPDPNKGWVSRTVTLDEYRRHYLDAPEPTEHLYLMNVALDDSYAEIVTDLGPLTSLPGKPLSPMHLWLGRAQTITPFHYDLPSNWLIQIAGTKHVLLAPPAATAVLEPFPVRSRSASYSSLDLEKLDDRHFCEFRRVRYQSTVITPGEALCMPSFWWHRATTLQNGMSVNRWWRTALAVVSPGALGRVVATEGFFGSPRVLAEFIDFDGNDPSSRWLPELLWSKGEAVYAFLAAGSVLVEALGSAPAGSVHEASARELVALAESCRSGGEPPQGDRLEDAFAALLHLIDQVRSEPARPEDRGGTRRGSC